MRWLGKALAASFPPPSLNPPASTHWPSFSGSPAARPGSNHHTGARFPARPCPNAPPSLLLLRPPFLAFPWPARREVQRRQLRFAADQPWQLVSFRPCPAARSMAAASGPRPWMAGAVGLAVAVIGWWKPAAAQPPHAGRCQLLVAGWATGPPGPGRPGGRSVLAKTPKPEAALIGVTGTKWHKPRDQPPESRHLAAAAGQTQPALVSGLPPLVLIRWPAISVATASSHTSLYALTLLQGPAFGSKAPVCGGQRLAACEA